MSGKIDLTAVQRQAAVERLGENIALCSGAGCGKTFVLARRFAELLRSRPDVEEPLHNFVALTFTDKAALEMSQRLRKTLLEFAAEADGPERRIFRRWLSELPEARISTIHGFCASLLRASAIEAGLDPAFTVCGEDDLMVRKLFADAAEQAVLEAVETGDAGPADLIERGGFGRVVEQVEELASMRTQCDLDHYLDEAATLRSWAQAIPKAQARIWADSGADEELKAIVAELESIPCRDPADLMAAARDQLVRALNAGTESGMGVPPMCTTGVSPVERERNPQGRDAPATHGRDGHATHGQDAHATTAPVLSIPPAGAFNSVAGIKLQGGSAKNWGDKEKLSRVKALIKRARERLAELAICAGGLNDLDKQSAVDLAVLARLAQAAQGRYQRQKRSRGLLDFTDLLEQTGKLLRDPAVASAARAGIHQLLLDEAQDTDVFQIQMLQRLLFGEALVEGAGGTRPLPPGRLFLVGDPKQSIYRFRGARVEVFADLCKRLGEGNLLLLDLSFRANRQTVGFINHLFGRMMGGEYARIEAQRTAIPPKESVEILLAAGEEEGPSTALEAGAFADAESASRAQAAVTAQRVAEMVQGGERLVWDDRAKDWRPVRWGDIAILFSRMTDSLQYERELAARDVAYYVVAGSGFFQQQEVLDVLNALAAIDNPFDDVALMGALRSGLFGLDDGALMHVAQACRPPYFQRLESPELAGRLDEPRRGRLRFAARLLGELHRRKDAVSIDRILEQLLEATGYEAVLLSQPRGRRLAGNVRRLMELARPGAAGAVSLADFLRQMGEHVLEESRYEQAAVVAEAEDVVRLMTIHKAKGLEFPVVILPDLSAGRRPVSAALLARPDLGLTYRPADSLAPSVVEGPDANGREDPEDKPLSCLLARRLETEDCRKEDVRRLYVGATRAQDHLVFVGADWRGENGAFHDPGSHMSMMGRHLDLVAAAAGEGRLEYEDGGKSYRAVVRRVPPPPPSRAGRSRPAGERLLAAAKSPEDLFAAALAAGASPPAAQAGGPGRPMTGGPMPGEPELLGPLPVGAGPADIAVTALSDFDRCPMLYRWRYELGIPAKGRRVAGGAPATHKGKMPSPRADRMPATLLDAAETGTLIHRCMEILDFSRPQPADLLVRQAAGDIALPPDVDLDEIARELGTMIETFLRHPLGVQVAAARKRLTELDFLLQQGPVRLAGKIDLLWQDERGGWHILDYKSDRAEGQDLSAYARRYELQMAAYALAASRYLGGREKAIPQEEANPQEATNLRERTSLPVVDATLYFLRLGETRSLPLDSDNLRAAAERLNRIASRLIIARRTREFPLCRSAGCRSCPYGRYCEAAGEAGGDPA